MNVIGVNFVKIDYEKDKSIFIEQNIRSELRKKCTLGKTFSDKFDINYTILKVENDTHIYEFITPSITRVTIKLNKHTIESDADYYFRAKAGANFEWPKYFKLNKRLFGLDIAEQTAIEFLSYFGNKVICLHGPRGCGKNLLVDKLQSIVRDRFFLKICLGRLRTEKDYLMDLDGEMKALFKNRSEIVVIINDLHKIENEVHIKEDLLYWLEEQMAYYEKYEEKSVTVMVTVDDIEVMSDYSRKFAFRDIYIGKPDKNATVDLLKYLINKKVGIEESNDVLEPLAECLHYLTPRSIETFIGKVYRKTKNVSAAHLIECSKDTAYISAKYGDFFDTIDPVRWSDIGGYDEVKKCLKEEIQVPNQKRKPIPRGLLLYGPPGCSKTMFVHALATECNFRLFVIKPSSVMRSLVGESESRMRQYLMEALASAPSIVFIDEIDMLIPKRDEKGRVSVGHHLFNEIITFMDGLGTHSDQKVLLVAATNRIEKLDSALLRAGRLDIKIEVGLPDPSARLSILKLAFNDCSLTADVIQRLPDISSLLANQSGAYITEICNKIKKIASFVVGPDNSLTFVPIPIITMNHVLQILSDPASLEDAFLNMTI